MYTVDIAWLTILMSIALSDVHLAGKLAFGTILIMAVCLLLVLVANLARIVYHLHLLPISKNKWVWIDVSTFLFVVLMAFKLIFCYPIML